jgi:F-type H+-transporting ATPase subunit delta
MQALRDRLSGLVAGTPILTATIDPGLIGGLVVQVGDQLYDASVKNRLAQLRHRLIEGKTHEIQSRRDQFSYPA